MTDGLNLDKPAPTRSSGRALGARWVYGQLLVLLAGSSLILLLDGFYVRLLVIIFVLGLPFSVSAYYAMFLYGFDGGEYSGREIFYLVLPVVLNVLLLGLAVRSWRWSMSASGDPRRLLGRRVAARILDLITYQVIVLVEVKVVPQTVHGFTTIASPWGEALGVFYLILGPVLIEPLFLHLFGATPGKWVCGLRVVTGEFGRPSPVQALTRSMGAFAIGLIPYLGCLLSFLFGRPSFVHDRLAGTSVVRVSRLPQRFRNRDQPDPVT